MFSIRAPNERIHSLAYNCRPFVPRSYAVYFGTGQVRFRRSSATDATRRNNTRSNISATRVNSAESVRRLRETNYRNFTRRVCAFRRFRVLYIPPRSASKIIHALITLANVSARAVRRKRGAFIPSRPSCSNTLRAKVFSAYEQRRTPLPFPRTTGARRLIPPPETVFQHFPSVFSLPFSFPIPGSLRL